MKNLNKYITLLCLPFLCTSCLDLSGLLYNPTPLEEYLYDDYKDGVDNIDAIYDLLPGEINEISVTSDLDGDLATIYGVYLGDVNTINQDTVILYCHGNAAHLDVYFQRAKMLYNLFEKSRYGVLLFDYRGFGRSEGTPSEEGLFADTKAMVSWLADQGLTGDRLYSYGFSLGSIPAVDICRSEGYALTPSKLLLEAPIGSIDAMAEDASGLSISSSFFADLKTNNIEFIKEIEQPLYWIHGEDDDFLAMLTQGLPVFNNHSGTFKESEIVPEGKHGNTPFVFGIENYITSVEAFFRRKE